MQNLFALLRSLHQLPDAATVPAGGSSHDAAAAAVAAAGEAVGALRLHVWQLLQQQAASYDGSGGAAETDAHLQVGGCALVVIDADVNWRHLSLLQLL